MSTAGQFRYHKTRPLGQIPYILVSLLDLHLPILNRSCSAANAGHKHEHTGRKNSRVKIESSSNDD